MFNGTLFEMEYIKIDQIIREKYIKRLNLILLLYETNDEYYFAIYRVSDNPTE